MSEPGLQSEPGWIYEGTVCHRRFAVRRRSFRHRLALFYLDVDRVGEVLDGRVVARAPRLVRFRREDYLGDPAVPLGDAVRALVEEQCGRRPEGPVRILTQLRTLGHCFNPVSFYYCFGVDERLEAVVAEVTNTPWGERHAYVLRNRADDAVVHGRSVKRLRVSPFMAMDQQYVWRVAVPGPTLSVQIENWEGGRRVFDASLSLRRAALSAASARRMWSRYPLATLRVLALIYGHALVLKLRGVPVYRKREAAA